MSNNAKTLSMLLPILEASDSFIMNVSIDGYNVSISLSSNLFASNAIVDYSITLNKEEINSMFGPGEIENIKFIKSTINLSAPGGSISVDMYEYEIETKNDDAAPRRTIVTDDVYLWLKIDSEIASDIKPYCEIALKEATLTFNDFKKAALAIIQNGGKKQFSLIESCLSCSRYYQMGKHIKCKTCNRLNGNDDNWEAGSGLAC